MKQSQVLVFGGTTEGRELAEELCRQGIACTLSVATRYGEQVMERQTLLTLHRGRLDAAQMRALIQSGEFLAVVDATHPFATEVSKNIRESLADTGLLYLRLKRNTDEKERTQEGFLWFDDMKSCAKALEKVEGNILLTTGSKELKVFDNKEVKKRLYVRVLPSIESISLCEEQGIYGRQIIAMQGPFSTEMNEAMIQELHISCMVTKESGAVGGFWEKIEAARNTNTQVMIIGSPEKEMSGFSFKEVMERILPLVKGKAESVPIAVSLIGMGVGNEELLTGKARKALREADVILGAKRLLEGLPDKKKGYPFYLAADIIPHLKALEESKRSCGEEKKAAVLFSGDTGFYSGTQKFYEELQKEIEGKRLNASVTIIPGISSLSYLASRIGIGWQNAAIVSIHGRKANLLETVRNNKLSFLLLSGLSDMKNLGELLVENELSHLKITYGYRLSYSDEEIKVLTPKECPGVEKEGLCCCFIENEKAGEKILTHGVKDISFLRGNTPMTKEEIREVSICKLGLTKESVLYDIGSGTGSIAVECARLSEGIQVYAIERESEAAELTRENCDRFGLANVTVVEAQAPEGFQELPAPTHVFIGGSGGKLREILTALKEKAPSVKAVINAITLETLSEVTSLIKEYNIKDHEVVQLQVSRAKKAGPYHLMQAENPIYIITFRLDANEHVRHRPFQ